MPYQFGTKVAPPTRKNSREAPKSSSGFPTVSSLGGLPRPSEKLAGKIFPDPKGIVLYSYPDGVIVLKPSTYQVITTDYITTQPTSIAASSYERLNRDSKNPRYIGLGSYMGISGKYMSVIDTLTVPWITYENYAITGGTGGNNIVPRMAPSKYGYVAGYGMNSTDEGVFDIVTKAETGGQPAGFTGGSGAAALKVYGDYLYFYRTGVGLRKFLFTTSTLSEVASNTSIQGPANAAGEDIAVTPDESKIFVSRAGELRVFDSNLNYITEISGGVGGDIGFLEVSPDGTKLLIGIPNSIKVMDTTTYSLTTLTSGGGQSTGCGWYPDSDGYVASYYQGNTHFGRVSSGGKVKDFITSGIITTTSVFGVAILE